MFGNGLGVFLQDSPSFVASLTPRWRKDHLCRFIWIYFTHEFCFLVPQSFPISVLWLLCLLEVNCDLVWSTVEATSVEVGEEELWSMSGGVTDASPSNLTEQESGPDGTFSFLWSTGIFICFYGDAYGGMLFWVSFLESEMGYGGVDDWVRVTGMGATWVGDESISNHLVEDLVRLI